MPRAELWNAPCHPIFTTSLETDVVEKSVCMRKLEKTQTSLLDEACSFAVVLLALLHLSHLLRIVVPQHLHSGGHVRIRDRLHQISHGVFLGEKYHPLVQQRLLRFPRSDTTLPSCCERLTSARRPSSHVPDTGLRRTEIHRNRHTGRFRISD